MNKQTYLAKLAQLLAPLPEQERQDALNYYEEYLTPQARKLRTPPPPSWATPPTPPAKFWRARA